MKRHFGKRAAIIFAISVSLLIGALLLSLLFSKNVRYPVPLLTPKDWKFQTDLAMRELPRLLRNERGERAVVLLTPDQVNTVLRFVANGGSMMAMMRPNGAVVWHDAFLTRPFQASYDRGEFDVVYTYDTGMPLLFGGGVTVRLRVRPELENGMVRLITSTLQIGSIPLGGSVADCILGVALKRLRRHKEMQKFLTVVERIKIDEHGNLELVYRPYELNRMFLAGLGRRQSGRRK